MTPGTRFGGYEIVSALGAGGMGEVFRARDTRLSREVALKLLPAAFSHDPERLARFRREAQVLAALNDPHIAAIYGLEEADDVIALALELAEGEDLAERLKRGPLPADEALAVARQIAVGLEAAHEKGIVHRDLKPANIKVAPDGKVKILDFGLAKAWESEPAGGSSPDLSQSPTMTRGTEAAIILGTAAYMSPEQARGKRVDKRTDVWAFGVVLWEMLTGERLFAGETVSDTLAAVLRKDVDFGRLPHALGPEVRRLLERCLERDPARRLRDIGEARIALEGDARRVEAEAPPGVSRRQALVWTVLSSGAAFAAGLGVGTRFAPSSTSPAARAALEVTPVTSSGNVTAAAISPDGRYVVYVESDHGQQSLWLKQLAGGQTLRLVADQAVAYWGLTFTPDGNNIVFGRKSPTDLDGSLSSISTLGGIPRLLLRNMDSQVSFSPDGQRFAFTRLRHPSPEETSVMVASRDGSNVATLASFKYPERVAGIFYGAPAWSPDGRSIATAVNRLGARGVEGGARIVRIAVEGGAVTTLSDPGWTAAAQVAWLPDGKSLVAIARAREQVQPQIWIVSSPSGAARPVTGDLNDHRIVSLTRDGSTLVSVAGNISSTLVVSSLREPGKGTRIGRSLLDGLNGVDFAPDGRIVYVSNGDGGWTLWSAGADGGEQSPLVSLPSEEAALFFPVVAATGEIFYLLRTRSGTVIRATTDGASSRVVAADVNYDRFAVTADGRTVVHVSLVGGEEYVFRTDVASGRRTRIFDRPAFTPSLDPSGRRVSFYFVDADKRARLGVMSIDGGPMLFSLPAIPPTSVGRQLLVDDGIYLNTIAGDRGNVWFQPLDGSPARRITPYEDQHLLFDFALSRDGARLAVVRGPRHRDAQLITGFGPA